MLPAYPLTIGVVISSEELSGEVTAALGELPVRIAFEQRQIGDWSEFLEKLNRTQLDVVVVELSQLDDPLEDVVRQIKATSASPMVIVVHETANSETILKVIRANADEYLYPPLAGDLNRALNRIAAERASTKAGTHPRGRIVGFLSAKGGCGTTTIACHVATELRRQTNLQVLLADFDMETGIVGFLMKTQSRYSLEDALSNSHRMDLSFWKALVAEANAGVEVIVAPPNPVSPAEHHPLELRDILRFVRSNYDWIVVDLGRVASPRFRTVLEEVDALYLVTTPDIPALHRAKETRRHILNGSAGDERVRLVLNRLPRRTEVTLREMERLLGTPIYATIGNDERGLYEAYAEGGLIPAKSKLGKQFAGLAARIAGIERKKRGRLSFLSI